MRWIVGSRCPDSALVEEPSRNLHHSGEYSRSDGSWYTGTASELWWLVEGLTLSIWGELVRNSDLAAVRLSGRLVYTAALFECKSTVQSSTRLVEQLWGRTDPGCREPVRCGVCLLSIKLGLLLRRLYSKLLSFFFSFLLGSDKIVLRFSMTDRSQCILTECGFTIVSASSWCSSVQWSVALRGSIAQQGFHTAKCCAIRQHSLSYRRFPHVPQFVTLETCWLSVHHNCLFWFRESALLGLTNLSFRSFCALHAWVW